MDVSLESSPVCSPSPAKEVPMSPLSRIYASLKWTFFSVQKWENWWYKAAHSRRQTFCESLENEEYFCTDPLSHGCQGLVYK